MTPSIRTWPENTTLPDVPVVLPTAAWLEADSIRYPTDWEPDHRLALDEEFALRELWDLDLDDPDVLLQTV